MLKPALVLMFTLIISACTSATLTKSGSSIRDIDASAANKCKFVGDITESAYSGMVFASTGVETARKLARNKAAELGATHVLWGNIAAGGAVQVVSAKGYHCGG